MKRVMILLVGFWLSTSAFGLTLAEAKQQGKVGETLSGYLAPRVEDKETQLLVEKINSGRQQQYQQVAKQNNMSANDVARLAGQKLVERSEPGEWVRGINGKWLQRSLK